MDVTDTAAHECVSEEALAHLKTYKYSSVDKSLISHYILRHYVRDYQLFCSRGFALIQIIVEWLCRTSSIMAGSKHGHIAWIRVHSDKCHYPGDIYSGSNRTCECCWNWSTPKANLPPFLGLVYINDSNCHHRVLPGYIIALHSAYGCKA